MNQFKTNNVPTGVPTSWCIPLDQFQIGLESFSGENRVVSWNSFKSLSKQNELSTKIYAKTSSQMYINKSDKLRRLDIKKLGKTAKEHVPLSASSTNQRVFFPGHPSNNWFFFVALSSFTYTFSDLTTDHKKRFPSGPAFFLTFWRRG
jgi:hypothetical protein